MDKSCLRMQTCAHLKQHRPLSAAESHVQRHFLVKHLVISTTANWELEVAGSASQLSVDLRVGVKSVIHTASLLFIKHDLQYLAIVLLGAYSLANDLDWVHNIGQNSIVDSSQSPGSWSLLCLRSSGSV